MTDIPKPDSHPETHPDRAFDRELRAWAARPAPTPPHRAKEILARRLDENARGESWWAPLPLATAAALVLAVVAGWWILGSGTQQLPSTEEMAVPVLDENVALIWLNAETPLYLTLTPPTTAKEPSS